MSPKSEPCRGGCGLAMPEPGMCVGCLEGARLVNGIAIDRLRKELAEARAIGELEREFLNAALVEFEGTVERDATGASVPRYQRLKKAHAALVASRPVRCANARAATGESKEADRG